MRLWGALLLCVGGLLLGLSAAAQLRRRARQLWELERAMELAGYALGRFCPPTLELAQSLAESAPGAGGALFARLAVGLQTKPDEPLDTLWAQAMESVDGEARPCLLVFGRVLGRYGAQEQARAAADCREALHRLTERANERAGRSGRVYIALGAAGAAMAAIVML